MTAFIPKNASKHHIAKVNNQSHSVVSSDNLDAWQELQNCYPSRSQEMLTAIGKIVGKTVNGCMNHGPEASNPFFKHHEMNLEDNARTFCDENGIVYVIFYIEKRSVEEIATAKKTVISTKPISMYERTK